MKKLLILPAIALLLASAAWAADGEAIYKANCAGCHGADGSKVNGEAALKGQGADAILKKLQGYVAGTYGGKSKTVMEAVAKKHKDDLKAIADYAGTL